MSPELPEIDLDHTALFLDVDGTLLDIAAEPSLVQVPSWLPFTLTDLAARCGGALALVSGRAISSLDQLFVPVQLAAAGCHGAEIRPTPAGAVDLQAAKVPDDLRETFLSLAEGGVLLEDKGATLALHYRAVENPTSVLDHMVAIKDTVAAQGYELVFGKKVVELRPHGVDKGTAIKAFMSLAPFSGRRAVFAGDDTTDNDAFAQLLPYDGLGIAVGARNPLAKYWAPTPGVFRDWIRALHAK